MPATRCNDPRAEDAYREREKSVTKRGGGRGREMGWGGEGLGEAKEFLFFPSLPTEASDFLFLTEELGPSPQDSDPVLCRRT